jgi:DNA-directed RNA polymerase subunit RPC12/RpoP
MAAVETIGQALDAGWAVTVRCAWGRREGLKSVRECMERRDLDLATLVWTRGRDCPLDLLPDRMRCPRCGSRRVRMLFTPPDGRSIAAA